MILSVKGSLLKIHHHIYAPTDLSIEEESFAGGPPKL